MIKIITITIYTIIVFVLLFPPTILPDGIQIDDKISGPRQFIYSKPYGLIKLENYNNVSKRIPPISDYNRLSIDSNKLICELLLLVFGLYILNKHFKNRK